MRCGPVLEFLATQQPLATAEVAVDMLDSAPSAAALLVTLGTCPAFTAACARSLVDAAPAALVAPHLRALAPPPPPADWDSAAAAAAAAAAPSEASAAAVLGWARVLLTRRLPCLLHVATPAALALASLAAAEPPTTTTRLSNVTTTTPAATGQAAPIPPTTAAAAQQLLQQMMHSVDTEPTRGSAAALRALAADAPRVCAAVLGGSPPFREVSPKSSRVCSVTFLLC